MTARKKKQPVPALTPEQRETLATGVIITPIQAAETAAAYLRAPYQDCSYELTLELTRQVKAVNQGDLGNAEGLLISQAHTLNIIFYQLLQRARIQEEMPHIEGFTKLALRAQFQCARTLEILSTIKNPPNVSFVKQANIAHNQQVNNGTLPDQPPTIQSLVIDQLEHTHGNYLDTGAARMVSENDPALATLGEDDRTEDARG